MGNQYGNRRLENFEVFIENSSYGRTHIKTRLIREKIIPYVCCSCRNTGEWNGKKLVLQLDHINGVNNDNRIENLQFICPNCHSQTPTYAGKNQIKRVRVKQKSNFRKEKRERDIEKWSRIKTDPSIRYPEWGWQSRLALLLEISSQKVIQWIRRIDPAFLTP
jgi:5-methylcytosine-specific restriction endonuclease McrA